MHTIALLAQSISHLSICHKTSTECGFGVLNFKLRYTTFRLPYHSLVRLQTSFYSRTVTMVTDKIIVDSEYVENISLSELQPPRLRTMLCIVWEFFTCTT